jgi:hypothetical protein
MDLTEGAVDRVQTTADYIHDKIVPDNMAVRWTKTEVQLELEIRFRYKHIVRYNPELTNEYAFEVQREAYCGAWDGSSYADKLERIIGECETDSDYVDPFKQEPELEDQMYEYIDSEIKKIDFRNLRLQKRRDKRNHERSEKRRYEYGY